MPEMKIKPKFELGQVVFLTADADQYPRVVTAFYVIPSGLLYELRYSSEEATVHSVIEISEHKSVSLEM